MHAPLLVKRVVFRFRRAFKRGDKVVAIALVRFIAHLVNQQVVHELPPPHKPHRDPAL